MDLPAGSIGDGGEPRRSKDELSLLVSEAQRVSNQALSLNSHTLTIMQALFLAAAGAVAFYNQQPLGLAAVPILWTVWLQYTLILDTETQKMATYGRWLEDEVNRSADKAFLLWETVATKRSARRPVVYIFSYVYWALINAASWALGAAIVWKHLGHGWTVLYVGMFVGMYLIAIWSYFQRNSTIRAIRDGLLAYSSD